MPSANCARWSSPRSDMITVAERMRPGATRGDADVVAALTVLRRLAARVRFLEAEAAEHETTIRAADAVVAPGPAGGARGRPDRGRDRTGRLVPPAAAAATPGSLAPPLSPPHPG